MIFSISPFATISVVNFFHWLFRQSITTVVITLSACFIIVALQFAIGIYIYGIRNPECIFGVDFSTTQYFMDAFILSWTTLATCVRWFMFKFVPIVLVNFYSNNFPFL